MNSWVWCMSLQSSQGAEPSRYSATANCEVAFPWRTVRIFSCLISIIFSHLTLNQMAHYHNPIPCLFSLLIQWSHPQLSQRSNSSRMGFNQASQNVFPIPIFLWSLGLSECDSYGFIAVPFLEIDWQVQSQKRLETSPLFKSCKFF